jgi:hypothetical protein
MINHIFNLFGRKKNAKIQTTQMIGVHTFIEDIEDFKKNTI